MITQPNYFDVPAEIQAGPVTHVLAWLPEYLTGQEPGWAGGAPGWGLFASTDYSVSAGGCWVPVLFEAPRDADPEELAESAAEELGYAVVLTPDVRQYKLSRWSPRWHTEPIYYVTPAQV